MLGCGYFVVVKIVRYVFMGEWVVVKVIDKIKFDEIFRVYFVKEVWCMKFV